MYKALVKPIGTSASNLDKISTYPRICVHLRILNYRVLSYELKPPIFLKDRGF
jgi:hypothetical protein